MLCIFLVFVILTTVSCTGEKYSQKQFCNTLFSDYTAEADFTLSDSTKSIDGKIAVTKSDSVKIEIVKPSEYGGISITSDGTGKGDIMSFELSGIPAAVPKSIARDLSLMFTLFSDLIPSKISGLENECFEKSEESDVVKVSFSQNGTDFSVAYDSVSYNPLSFDAGNDEMSVNITFTNINQVQKKELK